MDELKEELKYWKTKLYTTPVHTKEFDRARSECARIQKLILEKYYEGKALDSQCLNIGNYTQALRSIPQRKPSFVKRVITLIQDIWNGS